MHPLVEKLPSLSRLFPRVLPPALAVKYLDDGDGEGESLAGTGAALAHEALPIDYLTDE